MSFGRCCALLVGMALIGFAGAHKVRADSIAGTGWKGKGADNNWSTANNWDSNPPTTDGSNERNLFFGQGYFNAGNNGFTTSNNNLTGWAGYRMTFEDISGQPDVSFTITGNGFTLFDFGGGFPKIENSSDVTQTISLTSGQTITLQGGGAGKAEINPVNGNLVFSAGTKIQLNSPLDVYGNNGANSFTATFNDVISGGNPITLYNNSTVALNAANTYTGNTNIKNGTVLVGANAPSGSAGALGNSTNAVQLGDNTGTGNATLLTSGAFTVGRAINLLSGNTGTITIGGNTAAESTYSGNITLGTASGTAKSVTLVAAAGGSVDFSGVINENTSVPNSNVTIGDASHTGTVKLSNSANAYAGVTTVTNGATLEVVSLGTGTSNSSIGNSTRSVASNLVLSNGTLKYTGAGETTSRSFTFDSAGGSIDASGAGALAFNSSAVAFASGTGSRTLTLTGTNTGANSIASVIANPSVGATSVVKNGNGTWTLSGANSYSGGTTVSGGTLTVANSSGSATGSGNVTVDSGATLAVGNGATTGAVSGNIANNGSVQFNRSNASTYSGQISGTGSLTKLGAGILTLSASNSYGGGTTVSAGNLTGTTTSLQGNITNNAAVTFNQSTIGTYLGNMSGTGSLTINGSGTVTLSGTNSYGGGTTVSSVSTLIGTTTSLQGNIINDGTLVFAQSSDSTYSASMSGNGWLRKQGAAKLTLNGVNTYGSFAVVDEGTLSITNGGSLSGSGGGIALISGGSAAATVGGGTGTSTWTMSSSLSVGTLGTGTLNITGGGSVTSSSGIIGDTAGSNGRVTVGGAGAGTPTWTNSGTLYVGYHGTGTLDITGGGNVISNGGSIGGGSGSNGAVTVGGGTGTSTWTMSSILGVGVLGTGTLNITGGGIVTSLSGRIGDSAGSNGQVTVGGGTGTSTWTMSSSLSVGTLGTGTLNITGGGSVSTSAGSIGVFTGNGTVTVGGGTGTSTWTNSSALKVGDFGTATLNINSGGLVSATALDGGNGTSSVNFNGGTLRITTTDSASNTINLLAGGGTVDTPTGGTTFTVTSAISGAGKLSKTGAGKLALSGANTYNGGTTISGGILQANNTTDSATGTGAVTVGNGGTLAGNGAISGAVTVNGGGTLAPGNSIDSLDVGAITFSSDGNGGSTFAVELNTNAPLSMADLLNANGGLSIVAGAILSLVDAGNTVLVPGMKLTLISYAGTWDNGIFLNRPDDSLVSVGANLYVINYNDPLGGANFGGGSYANHLTLTAVPEASAVLFGGLACLIVGLTYSARVFLRRRAVAMRS